MNRLISGRSEAAPLVQASSKRPTPSSSLIRPQVASTSNDDDVASTFRPPRGHTANRFMNIIGGAQDILGVLVFGGFGSPGVRFGGSPQ